LLHKLEFVDQLLGFVNLGICILCKPTNNRGNWSATLLYDTWMFPAGSAWIWPTSAVSTVPVDSWPAGYWRRISWSYWWDSDC